MRSRSVAMVFVLLGAGACVEADTGDAGEGDDNGNGTTVMDDGLMRINATVELPEGEYNVCEHLPAEPPCSLLCDRAALDAYVPERSCAVFVCTLTDGVQVTVHACHPPP